MVLLQNSLSSWNKIFHKLSFSKYYTKSKPKQDYPICSMNPLVYKTKKENFRPNFLMDIYIKKNLIESSELEPKNISNGRWTWLSRLHPTDTGMFLYMEIHQFHPVYEQAQSKQSQEYLITYWKILSKIKHNFRLKELETRSAITSECSEEKTTFSPHAWLTRKLPSDICAPWVPRPRSS